MSSSRRVPFYQLVDGIRRSPFLIPAIAREALKFRPGDGDIVLVTYAKAGTHWTQHIIQLILHRGRSASSFPDFVRRTPILENHGAKAIQDMPPPRTIRTHLQLLRYNFNDKAKYVYVARNPWDTCVSLYHFIRGLPKFQFGDGTFDEFFEAFVTGELGYGEYFEHVLHGYARKDEPNVFFFTYEELKADPRGIILKLAHFLGEEHGRALEDGRALLQEVLKKSSFEFMSQFLEPGAEEFSAVLDNLSTPAGKCRKAVSRNNAVNGFRFFREGKVNDWKTLFSPTQTQRMQVRIDQMTKGSDLMSLWNMN
ncbi:unnamed protein product [Ixodes hexagonus]